MAYLSFQNCTRQEYEQVLYSQDAKNKIKILFNNTELENADLYCEKLTVKSRILPNGGNVFSLSNFISKELELILRDIDTSIIEDQVSILIGTFVNDSYEYVPIGIFNIQNQPTNDKNKTTIKLRDNSVKFDFTYNAKPLIDANGGTATKLQILQDICTKAGVTCNISSFVGSTDLIGIYDNTITARQYIAYLAESAGKIATINRDGELIFVDLNSLTTWDIPLSIVEKYEIGKPYKIGQVIYEDGVVRFETPTTSYDKLYLDASNPYISTQEQVNSILLEVNDFEIDSATTGKILGNPAIDGYDLINIYDDKTDGNPTVLKTLATSDLTYTGVLGNTFDTQIDQEEREQNISIIGEPTFKKWVKAEYDNTNATLNIIAGEVTEQNSKIAYITQSVDEINSRISDVIDLTVSAETSSATLTINNINNSEPIQIIVKPIGTNISYIYPNSYLYGTSQAYPAQAGLEPSNSLTPSNSLVPENGYPAQDVVYLKTRKIRFHNNTTSEDIDYILPGDLLYYDSENYDEFTLDYGDGTQQTMICKITKKCKYKIDGTVELLSTPETVNYTYPSINLTDGDYTISLLGYSQAYIFVRLMAQNIYTTQFYTKAETNSIISQTASEINVEVNKKVGNNEIIAKINTAIENEQGVINITGNQVIIDSDNFSLTSNGSLTCTNASVSGSITSSSGTIGGFSINSSSFSKNVSGIYNYDYYDLAKAMQAVMNYVEITDNELKILDVDNNNVVNSQDFVLIRRILNGTDTNTKTASGTFQINSNNPKKCISVLGQDNTTVASMGVGGIDTTYLTCENFVCGKANSGGTNYQQFITGNGLTGELRCVSLTQTSKKEFKKNFEKLENALDIIKNTDIYKYNLIEENDEDKKHIGFVIGDNFKYRKELTSADNDGVDIYSLASVCLQAIKEQQEIIENLQKRIEKLERESDK